MDQYLTLSEIVAKTGYNQSTVCLYLYKYKIEKKKMLCCKTIEKNIKKLATIRFFERNKLDEKNELNQEDFIIEIKKYLKEENIEDVLNLINNKKFIDSKILKDNKYKKIRKYSSVVFVNYTDFLKKNGMHKYKFKYEKEKWDI